MFVDRVEVKIKAGNGGDGALSFRHEKFRARGGPDGGDGGNGGNVTLKASRDQNTLAAFRYKKLIQAGNGQSGGKRKRRGKKANDLEIAVPVGTIVVNKRGDALADLTEDGQTATIANGGQGGFGNAHFTSSTRQAPRLAEKGEKGEEVEATFELKMIADVGIIGLPNAGKSTLLSVVSSARPEIAAYPFTTITPNLGVVDIDQKHSLLLADIPGLIEGASRGKGLGDEFLRHVERTSVLLHLIDVYSDDMAGAYQTIMKELADYKVDLSQKPQIVALTKVEGFDEKKLDKKLTQLKQLVPRGTLVSAISSSGQQGINELLRILLKRVEQAQKQQVRRAKRPALPVIGLKPADNWKVEKTNDGFLVTGGRIERFARRTDFDNEDAIDRLRDITRRTGILREMERQGLQPGQTITIGQPPIGQIEY